MLREAGRVALDLLHLGFSLTMTAEPAGIAGRGREDLNGERVQRAAGGVGRGAQRFPQLRRHSEVDSCGSRFPGHRRNVRPR
jgi:hypothetical protein